MAKKMENRHKEGDDLMLMENELGGNRTAGKETFHGMCLTQRAWKKEEVK